MTGLRGSMPESANCITSLAGYSLPLPTRVRTGLRAQFARLHRNQYYFSPEMHIVIPQKLQLMLLLKHVNAY